MLLLSLLGCARPPDCVDLRTGDPFPNHIGPFAVAVDPIRRRVWTTSIQDPTLAGIDADTNLQFAARTVYRVPATTPHLAVDADGVVWLGARSVPALVRYDPDSGERTEITGFDTVDDLVATPSGLAVLGGAGSDRTLTLLGEDGTVVSRLPAEGYTGVHLTLDGVGLVGPDLVDLSLPDLAPRRRVALPEPMSHGAAMSDGSEALAGDTDVAWVAPDGTVRSWPLDSEATAIVAAGDDALVLDRHGPDDPNVSVAWALGPEGIRGHFPLGMLSAYGAVDPVSGQFWTNSEGTSEVLAFDPHDGSPLAAIRTGTWVDGIALPRDTSRVWYATGRLSDSVVRVEDGVPTTTTHTIRWPYSPLIDAARGRLWVLSHTTATVWGLDPDTLAPVGHIPLGAGANATYTFGNLAINPADGVLYASESGTDAVYALDPERGTVTTRWALGGPAITDAHEIGELAMRAAGDSGVLLIARTNDGRVQRLDTADGHLITQWLSDAERATMGDERRIDVLRVFPDRGLVYVGGIAFSLEDLTRRADLDLPFATIAGRDPATGEWLGMSAEGETLRRAMQGGPVLHESPISDRTLNAVQLRMGQGGATVLVGRANEGTVCHYDVADIE